MSGAMLPHALPLAERGWRMVPVGKNKRPLVKRWPELATTDAEQIHAWWTEEYPGAGIGVVCGAQSSLVVVDVDPRHDGDAGLRDLEQRYGPLPQTITVKTGGGGRHFYYRYPAGATIRNKTALDGVQGVDVRGEGGFVVAPPSTHRSGNRYEWTGESDQLTDLPPKWIRLLADPTPTRVVPTAEGHEGPRHSQLTRRTLHFLAFGAAEGGRNNELFKAAGDMAACGWPIEVARPRLLAGCAICRPPYDCTTGIDATIASAFSKDRRPSPSLRSDLSGRDGCGLNAATASGNSLLAKLPARPWAPFPTHRLPEPLRSFVDECAAAIGCDPAMVALPALATVATAVGMSRRIRLKRTWAEPAIVWSIIVAESGELKSPALDQARNVIDRIQERAFEEYHTALEDYEAAHLAYDADLNAWKDRRANRGRPPEKPERPVCARLIVEDITTEAIAPILRDNPRGVLLCRDELSGWLGSFDNYHAGRGGDVARWLEMHRGGTLIVDRKTGRERTIYVPRAAVSVTGTVQPATLRHALGRTHIENGLAARMLMAMPPRKPKRWSDRELSKATAVAFEQVIGQLYSLQLKTDPEGRQVPEDLPLTPEGKVAWIRFYNRFANEQAAVMGDLAKAFAKLEGYAARFALLVHLLRWAANDPTVFAPDAIDAESVEAGAAISEWFCDECERVYSLLSESDADRASRQLVDWIAARGGAVTVRDLTHGLRRFRGDADAAQAAVDDLVSAELGRWNEMEPGPAGGRPTRRFELVSSVTVTETPRGATEDRGFGDGDSGDDHEHARFAGTSDPVHGSAVENPDEVDLTLVEDVEAALAVLGQTLPGIDPTHREDPR